MQCLNCRSFIRTCVHGVAAEDLEKELEDDAKQEEYNSSLLSWEDIYNSTKGYLKGAAAKVTLPTWVSAIQEEGTESVMHVGVFWPKSVYDAHEAEPLAKHSGTPYRHCGNTYMGIWRDKKHGEPMGTITCNKLAAKKAQKTTQLSHSDMEFRKGGLGESFAGASSMATGFDAKLQKSVDGEPESISFSDKQTAATQKKRTLCMRGSDSSDDWGSSLMPGFAKKARLQEDDSEAEVRPKAKAKTKARAAHAPSSPAALRRSKQASSEDLLAADPDGVKPSPTKASKASKMYPSEQLRHINQCVLVVNDCNAGLSMLANAEGLTTCSAEKFKALLAKVDANTSAESSERLTNPTTTKLNDASPDKDMTLTEKGVQLLGTFNTLREKLMAAIDISTALKAIAGQGSAFESYPTFLSYALGSATSLGLDVHPKAHSSLLTAHVLDIISAHADYEEPLVAALNKESDDRMGLSAMAKVATSQESLDEAQTHAVSAIMMAIAESESDSVDAYFSRFITAVNKEGLLVGEVSKFLCALATMLGADGQSEGQLKESIVVATKPSPVFDKFLGTRFFVGLANRAAPR